MRNDARGAKEISRSSCISAAVGVQMYSLSSRFPPSSGHYKFHRQWRRLYDGQLTMRRFPAFSSGSSSCDSKLDKVSSPADLSRFIDASFQPARCPANPWRKESILGSDERFIATFRAPPTPGSGLHQQSEQNHADRAGCHAAAEQSPQSPVNRSGRITWF